VSPSDNNDGGHGQTGLRVSEVTGLNCRGTPYRRSESGRRRGGKSRFGYLLEFLELPFLPSEHKPSPIAASAKEALLEEFRRAKVASTKLEIGEFAIDLPTDQSNREGCYVFAVHPADLIDLCGYPHRSMRSATSLSNPRQRTCSSSSSPAATSAPASSSPLTRPSAAGVKCSATKSSPPP
jgi:hypothetical protein